ncbi:hypothetical protein [Mesonia mobilis]|uniref:hypothetical protein n=2 Tax=Mesonia mobilis TaxID=369791 RepID=UPI0024BBBDD7|nr:hypothetical protein [Mesonia mobilis]
MKKYLNYYLRHNYLLKREIKSIENYFKKDSIEEEKNKAFIKILGAAKKTNFYPNFYDENGINIYDVKCIDDLIKLPVLKKEDVKKEPSAFLSTRKKILATKAYTSGTTGTPMTVFRDFNSIVKENAYVWWYRNYNGLGFNDKKISFRKDLKTNFYFEKISNTLYISPSIINNFSSRKLIDTISEFKPKAILSYPSTAYNLALILEKCNKTVNIPLTFTSSESIIQFQKTKIESILNTKICDWYGNAERTISLYLDGDKYFEPPLYSINTYLPNRIETTSLINEYFPLIKYQVNDIIDFTPIFNEEKKSFEISKIIGRSEDTISLEDGTRINRINRDFVDIHGLERAQIIQESINTVELRVVLNDYENFDKELLLKNLHNRFNHKIKIDLKIVNKEGLIHEEGKKFKFVISRINN